MRSDPPRAGSDGPHPPARAGARPTPPWRLAAAVAVLLGLLAHRAASNFRRGADARERAGARPAHRTTDPHKLAAPSAAELRWRARAKALPHLDRADAECRAALARGLRELDDFFAEARRWAPGFAERVLGWRSKWLLLTDQLRPGTGGHAEYRRRAFRKELFSPEQLEDAARRAVAGYLDAVRDAEGAALVALRADLPAPPIIPLDRTAIGAQLERALAVAAVRAGSDLRGELARELTALVVGEVLALAAVRTGTSAGLLGVGAASTAATFGLGLAAGVLVDALLSWAWDGRAELVRELQRRLDGLRQSIVQGTDEAPGLRRRMEALDRRRSTGRRAAVLGLVEYSSTGGGR
jgi:hypothetical protein